ncbi:hypothetical protein AAFF_G00169690 [Aldrovandia affinis]|uniref:Uncharacterized protein n=1 Tax=Aldrovandia affinis TaxID=143900 RepID=A0AAD7RLQ3_9TELE|nr:hypothetical protein AAFF_G00169690 [Aldrovandia affinis]
MFAARSGTGSLVIPPQVEVEGDNSGTTTLPPSASCFGNCGACGTKLGTGRRPLLLPCLHSVCHECVPREVGVDFVDCPLCGVGYSLKDVTDDPFCKESQSASGAQSISPCGGCEATEVHGWCVDCGEALCSICISAHKRVRVTREHTILPQRNSRVPSPTVYCKAHRTVPAMLFCLSCDHPFCRDCFLRFHKKHSFKFLQDAAIDEKENIRSLMEKVKLQRKTVRKSLSDLDRRLLDLTELQCKVNEQLRDTLKCIKAALLDRATRLTMDVQNLYNAERGGVLKRQSVLRKLEERQSYLLSFTERALETESHTALLSCREKIHSQLRDVLSCATFPGTSMMKVTFRCSQDTYNQIAMFGTIVAKPVPFACTDHQNTPHLNTASPISPLLLFSSAILYYPDPPVSKAQITTKSPFSQASPTAVQAAVLPTWSFKEDKALGRPYCPYKRAPPAGHKREEHTDHPATTENEPTSTEKPTSALPTTEISKVTSADHKLLSVPATTVPSDTPPESALVTLKRFIDEVHQSKQSQPSAEVEVEVLSPQLPISSPGSAELQPQLPISSTGSAELQPQLPISSTGSAELQPQLPISTPGSAELQPQLPISTPGSAELQPQLPISTPGSAELQPQLPISTPCSAELQPQSPAQVGLEDESALYRCSVKGDGIDETDNADTENARKPRKAVGRLLIPRISLLRIPVSFPHWGFCLEQIARDTQLVFPDSTPKSGAWNASRPSIQPRPVSAKKKKKKKKERCAVCHSGGELVLCTDCGRSFHRDCYVPLNTATDSSGQWQCMLCEDLSDVWSPCSREPEGEPSLSLADQRKCEHLFLTLISKKHSAVLYQQSELLPHSSHYVDITLIRGRLLQKLSPAYRTPSEFVSDIWLLLDTLSKSLKVARPVAKLQKTFRKTLRQVFWMSLHPSLLESPQKKGEEGSAVGSGGAWWGEQSLRQPKRQGRLGRGRGTP